MIHQSINRPSEEQIARVQARIDLKQLLDTPGWKDHIQKILLSGIQASMNALRKVNTADPAVTVDAVQRWQLRHNDYEALCNYVNAVIADDDPEDGSLKLSDMETMLQEALYGRSSGDPTGTGTGPTGD